MRIGHIPVVSDLAHPSRSRPPASSQKKRGRTQLGLLDSPRIPTNLLPPPSQPRVNMRAAPLVRSRGYTGAWGPNLNGGMGGLTDDRHYLYMGMRPPAGFSRWDSSCRCG